MFKTIGLEDIIVKCATRYLQNSFVQFIYLMVICLTLSKGSTAFVFLSLSYRVLISSNWMERVFTLWSKIARLGSKQAVRFFHIPSCSDLLG